MLAQQQILDSAYKAWKESMSNKSFSCFLQSEKDCGRYWGA